MYSLKLLRLCGYEGRHVREEVSGTWVFEPATGSGNLPSVLR